MNERKGEFAGVSDASGADQGPPQEPLMISLGDGDDRITAYICFLIARDCAQWGPRRRTELQKHEALSFAKRLSSLLPEARRARLPDSVKRKRASLKRD